jgi:hypothetical protein
MLQEYTINNFVNKLFKFCYSFGQPTRRAARSTWIPCS